MDESERTDREPTVDVYVVEPGGPCNYYHWDTRLGVPVLDAIQRPADPRGADLARLPLDPHALHAARETQARRLPAWAQDAPPAEPQRVLASLGQSVQVLVLADPPNPPGTRVSVRIIGAIDLSAPAGAPSAAPLPDASALSHLIALAVPAADASLAHVRSASDLPEPFASRLSHALTRLGGMGGASADGSYRMLTAEAALERLRSSRVTLRVAQRAQQQAERLLPEERLSRPRASGPSAREARIALGPTEAPPSAGPAWRGLSGLSTAELRTRGEAVYGESEQLLRWVPTRFVRYLDELLMPDEPLLFFAECPDFTVRGWTGELSGLTTNAAQQAASSRGSVAGALDRFRTRHVRSGLLLITDRQALLVRDYAAPDATMVQWGYRAHSWPLSLLAGVRLLPAETVFQRAAIEGWPHAVRERAVNPVRFDETSLPPRLPRLALGLEGERGVEITGVAFPARQGDALAAGAQLLEAFLPFPATSGRADRRLRVVATIEPWRPTEAEAAELISLGGMIPQQVAEQLERALAASLRDGEQVLVQARTPSASGERDDSALLALTGQRLLVVRASAIAGDDPKVEVHPITSITSTTLQHSLLACELRWNVPDSRHPSAIHVHGVRFPSTLIVPFRALYTRLRLSLGRASRTVEVPHTVGTSGVAPTP